MTFPIAIHSESKRAMDAIDTPKRVRLNSDKGVKSDPSGNLLPVEIWQKIALELDRCALNNFSLVSKFHKSVSLAPFNFQTKSIVSKEIQMLAQLQPFEAQERSIVMECYQSIYNELELFGQFSSDQEYHNDPEVLLNLQKQLLVLSKDHIENKLSIVSQNCLVNINKTKMTFEDIKKEYISARNAFAFEALACMLNQVQDYNKAKSFALANAARMNCYEVVEFLLLKDPGAPNDVGYAVVCSAQSQNWDMLLFLLSHGVTSDDDRENAAMNALAHGHVEIVKKLIYSGPISALHRNFMIEAAKEQGYQEIIEILSAKDSNASIELA